MIQEKIKEVITRSLTKLGVPHDMVKIELEHPGDPKFGDYSTNVAMSLFRQLGATAKTPFELAEKIAAGIQEEIKYGYDVPIEKVEAVGVGFVNFFLSKKFFKEAIAEALDKTAWFGKGTKLWNKKIIIEHTNLNPFKPFHIGHLVNNSVGESLTRILEFQDAKIVRASYGGDIGLHVAKTLWGVMQLAHENPEMLSVEAAIEFLGKAYVLGSASYDEKPEAAEEIKNINKKIFDKSDEQINNLYAWGRKSSIAYFEMLYKRLGTRVDIHFFESEVAAEGAKIVNEYLEKGVFEKSEGAVIFPGEKFGLHNRVFISSQGLPTYEAKEIGLTRRKFEMDNFDESIIVTANEQDDYFKVVIKALSFIYPEISLRTHHVSHGMLRFASGKMSSRKGNVITGESLLNEVEAMAHEKIKDSDYPDAEKMEIAERVAIAAIKYSILKQSIGRDTVFDPETSLSFEGDSGPYLQYTYVRSRSIIEKAREEGIVPNVSAKSGEGESVLERIIYRFPEVVERASDERAPQYIATYLVELAGAFNSYYARNKIIDTKDTSSAYRVAVTDAVRWTLKNGLYLLGIQAPTRM